MNNQLLDILFDNAHTLVAHMDNHFRFIRVNTNYAAADQKTPTDFAGKNHFELYPNAENQRIFENVVQTGTPYLVKAKPFVYAAAPERNVTHWDWSLWPIKNNAGEVIELVMMLRDVTDRIRAEEKSIELLAEKERAEEAARAKSAFTTMINHELRTPLNALVLAQAQMERKYKGTELQHELQIMRKSARQLKEIIENVLEYARLEAKEHEHFVTRFNLPRLLSDMVDVNRTLIEKSVEIYLEMPPRMPTHFTGDYLKFSDIVRNLLSNAVKYTRAGKIVMKVDWSSAAAQTLKLSVSDTGIGIPAEYMSRLFEPYEREANAQTARQRGTGLGLAIVSRHLANMRGSISVDSVPGQGTTFGIELPLEPCARWLSEAPPGNYCSACINKTEEGAGKPEIDPGPLKKLRYLIVEDNEVNALLLEQTLRHYGIGNIEIAGSAAAAVALSMKNLYDIILLDLHLPDGDGFEIFEQIRKKPDFKALVLAVTAAAEPAILGRCRRAGMNGVITKPVGIQDLFDQLTTVVRAHRA